MSHPIPKTVTRDQYVSACLAFCRTLGFDASLVYFPTVLTTDAIHFPAVVRDVPSGRKAVMTDDPQGAPMAALATPVVIKVVDEEVDA